MINRNAIWLITGCSKGLGRALAEQALGSGYRVAVTARRMADVADLAAAHGDAALAIELDVTDAGQIAAAVAATEARFGGLDVLVNNAGYGYLAAIEEGEDADIRALFETNVFGPLNLIKAALPGMRRRGRGHIVNLSSIGGIVTFPAVGHYHMAKFAVEALSETLAQEVAPLGIGVTVVEPGAFRTDFRGPASVKQSATRIAAYAGTAGKARDAVLAGHGKQQGDPARGARAIITAVEAERPPLHLVIGGDALGQFRQKLADLHRELDAWEEVTRSTDFRTEDPA
jgi:NAD(P)-dependent dehydrogenase (short-subunit alcohol dehydrogenase family)